MTELKKIDPNSITQYRNMKHGDLWKKLGRQGQYYWTINHEKCTDIINQLISIERKTITALGHFFTEIRTKINEEVDQWDFDYYKDPDKKPEYMTLEQWCNDHIEISYSQVKRYIWLFGNVAESDHDLGYKKNKIIFDHLESEPVSNALKEVVRDFELNENEVKELITEHMNNVLEWAESERIRKDTFSEEVKKRIIRELEKLRSEKGAASITVNKIELSDDGKTVQIKCNNKSDAKRVLSAVIDMENSIKKQAYKQ